MESFWVAFTAAAIGSILIILNEWVKVFFEQRKQKKKLVIWNALEQTGNTPPSFTIEQLSEVTKINIEQLKPLLYEMLQEGVIFEGSLHGTFTRYMDA